jgi:hypothetical protein
MTATELLWLVFEWLPRVFVLDVLVFHLVADHPLAARTWWPRAVPGRVRRRSAATLL